MKQDIHSEFFERNVTKMLDHNKFRVDEHNALHSFDHADGYYHLMGCMLSAASCNKWWMDEILKTTAYQKEQTNITKLGENSVFYLPYLMGERSPHNDPKARATFTGMTMDTTREDMTLAVLEGVAFGLRDSLEVARKLGIPVIGLIDTNCNPEDVDYAIPGNDDAIRAVALITDCMANAVIEGRQGESMEAVETEMAEGAEESETTEPESMEEVVAASEEEKSEEE